MYLIQTICRKPKSSQKLPSIKTQRSFGQPLPSFAFKNIVIFDAIASHYSPHQLNFYYTAFELSQAAIELRKTNYSQPTPHAQCPISYPNTLAVPSKEVADTLVQTLED